MSYKPVQSLQRGLAILDALANARDGQSLKALARVTGCSSAATFHLAQTLVAAGYVQRHENPARYSLGNKLHLLTQSQRQDRMSQVIDQQMQHIRTQIPDASIYFSQYLGGQVMVRTQLAARSQNMIQHEVNMALPPYISAAAVIHLAYWTDDQTQDYLQAYSFDVYGRLFWGSWKNFTKHLQKTRKNGVVLVPEHIPSHLKLGLPVLGPTGVLLGAMTIQWNTADKKNLATRKKQLMQLGIDAKERITMLLKGEIR